MAGSVERRRTRVEVVLARREFGVVLAVLGLIAFGVFVRADVFLTLNNLVGVLRSAAVVTLIAYGMTLLIVAGEFDLSVGSTMAVAAGVTAVMVGDEFSVVFTLLVVFLFAILYGVGQGLLVTKLGLPSLIVTIGTLTLLRGGHLVVTGNVTQTISTDEMPHLLWMLGGVLQLPFPVYVPFTDVLVFTIPALTYSLPVFQGPRTFDRFPLQLVWVFVLMAVFHYVLFYTRFGYQSQATGGDEQAARYTGVKTDQVKIANFAIVAVMATLAGVSQLAFTSSVSPLTGGGVELVVIAAVVIGGTNLFGGEGTITGSFLGALVFALTQNILVLAGFGTQLFDIFTGVFIIFAVAFDAVSRRARPDAVFDAFLDPMREIATRPRAFYRTVDEDVQGIDAPAAFLTLAVVVWAVPSLLAAVATYVRNPLTGDPFLPGEFHVFIVDGNPAAFGTMPLTAFGLTGVLAFLTVVYAHGLLRLLADGSGSVDATVQAVAYAFAPSVLYFVPFILEGLTSSRVAVAATALPLFAATGYLLVVGLQELHDLDAARSVGVVAGTALLWVVTLAYAATQVGL